MRVVVSHYTFIMTIFPKSLRSHLCLQIHYTWLLQGLLSDFVAYIEETKTVVLEDLAADFNMRVQVSHENALLHHCDVASLASANRLSANGTAMTAWW